MAKVMTSVQNMSDALEFAANSTDERLSGRMDAVAHVGNLMNGTYEVDQLDAIQNKIFVEASKDYREGYEEMWNSIYTKAVGF
jgi:hypothetical protein